ncbi:MAG: hypothetical protein GTO41_20105 [Burkholderiales bacterium]|nr:hypothetical protein [Burkholderiales bacterium]
MIRKKGRVRNRRHHGCRQQNVAPLRFLDEGLANAKDMDFSCRLGQSDPDRPIDRVEHDDLVRHYDITPAFFEIAGMRRFTPACRAVVAKQRKES